MDTLCLDPFSREFADALFAKYPEWQTLGKAESAEDGSYYLDLVVPAPESARADYGLVASTNEGVVLVGFDHFHTHIYACVGDGNLQGPEFALRIIDQFVTEEISAISWWHGNELVAFGTRADGVNSMPDDLVGSHTHTRIRSWRGNLNEDNDA